MTENNGEQTEAEEKKELEPKDSIKNSNDGVSNKDEGISLINDARKAAEELKKQNEIKLQLLTEEKKLIERREALMQLGGDSLVKKPSKKEETPQEYAAKLMRGEL